MSLETLNRRTRKFAESCRKKNSYPAVVVGAQKSRSKSYCKSGALNQIDIVSKLKKRLKSIGNLYGRINGNVLGCCAEANAANDLLVKKPHLKLNEIEFSTPLRPRTMQKIKMCKNCKQTFS